MIIPTGISEYDQSLIDIAGNIATDFPSTLDEFEYRMLEDIAFSPRPLTDAQRSEIQRLHKKFQGQLP